MPHHSVERILGFTTLQLLPGQKSCVLDLRQTSQQRKTREGVFKSGRWRLCTDLIKYKGYLLGMVAQGAQPRRRNKYDHGGQRDD